MLTRKNIINILLIAVVMAVLFIPDAKALVIRGLMQIGLFSPTIEQPTSSNPSDLSSIKFKSANEKVVGLEEFKGKIIFVNIWATWCPPCRAEMPSINKLYQQYKNDPTIVFLMVDADGDFRKSLGFMNSNHYEMPLYAFYSELPKTLFNRSVPTTFVFDKQGRLSFREEGSANYASKKFINFIEQLKAQKN